MAATATVRPKRMSNNQIKLYSDILLLISYVIVNIVNIPQATGIPFHEWISVIFIVGHSHPT